MNRAIEAAEILKDRTGICPAIYNIRYIKPLDIDSESDELFYTDVWLTGPAECVAEIIL